MALSKVSKDMLEKRKTLMNEFQAIRQRNEIILNSSKKRRTEMRETDSDLFDQRNPTEDETEETVEFLIKEETILLEEDD